MIARVALCATAVLLGASGPGQYHTIGMGMASCGKWTADRASNDFYARFSDQQWVVGFLSGVGYEGGGRENQLEGMDAEGVWAWVDNYCRANPINDIATAAAAFTSAHPR